jgi:hypothetical protein
MDGESSQPPQSLEVSLLFWKEGGSELIAFSDSF